MRRIIRYKYFINHRYLRTGTRRVQKRKTSTIKASFDPEYHSKLKYNACNVMGKFLNIFFKIIST